MPCTQKCMHVCQEVGVQKASLARDPGESVICALSPLAI